MSTLRLRSALAVRLTQGAFALLASNVAPRLSARVAHSLVGLARAIVPELAEHAPRITELA
jgi:hypothetical protein